MHRYKLDKSCNEFRRIPDEESLLALWPYAVAAVGLAVIGVASWLLALS